MSYDGMRERTSCQNIGFEGDDNDNSDCSSGSGGDDGVASKNSNSERFSQSSPKKEEYIDGKTEWDEAPKQRKCIDFMVARKGTWLTLTSAFNMALASMGIVYITDLSPNEITFSRMLIQMFCCLPFVAYQRASFRYTWTAYGMLLLRSILGSLNTSLVYVTFYLMPVASAKSILYTSQIFAGILGWIFLKETYSILDAIFSLVTLGGVFLIAQPPFLFGSDDSVEESSSSIVIGSLLSLLSAFLSAVILILMRKLSVYGMPSVVFLTVYSVVGTCFLAMLTSVLNQWTIPGCGVDRIILIGNGILHAISQIIVYIALKTEKASVVSLVHSSEIVFTFVLEYLFFGVIPNYFTVIGAVVIATGFAGLTTKMYRDSQNKSSSASESEKGDSNSDSTITDVQDDPME